MIAKIDCSCLTYFTLKKYNLNKKISFLNLIKFLLRTLQCTETLNCIYFAHEKSRILWKNVRNFFQYCPDSPICPQTAEVQDSSEFLYYLGYVTLIARSKHFVLEHKCDKRDNFC